MKESRLTTLGIYILGVPLLAVLMGGVFSLPAMKLTRERDPWLTLLLALGLGASIGLLGQLLHTPAQWSASAWGLSIVILLLARKFFGTLGHSLERFGIVHIFALLLSGLAHVLHRLSDSPS